MFYQKQELQRWIMMTTVGRIFEEEKQKAVHEAIKKERRKTRRETRRKIREASQLVLSEGISLGLPEDEFKMICSKLLNHPEQSV